MLRLDWKRFVGSLVLDRITTLSLRLLVRMFQLSTRCFPGRCDKTWYNKQIKRKRIHRATLETHKLLSRQSQLCPCRSSRIGCKTYSVTSNRRFYVEVWIPCNTVDFATSTMPHGNKVQLSPRCHRQSRKVAPGYTATRQSNSRFLCHRQS